MTALSSAPARAVASRRVHLRDVFAGKPASKFVRLNRWFAFFPGARLLPPSRETPSLRGLGGLSDGENVGNFPTNGDFFPVIGARKKFHPLPPAPPELLHICFWHIVRLIVFCANRNNSYLLLFQNFRTATAKKPGPICHTARYSKGCMLASFSPNGTPIALKVRNCRKFKS